MSAPETTLDEQVSPELALVDPGLRHRLVRDELRREQPAPESPPAAVVPGRPRRRRRLHGAVILLAAALLLSAGAGAWVRFGRTGSVAAIHVQHAAAVVPSSRTLAWAPVTGASGYDVQLRTPRGVAYSRRTARTTVRVPVGLPPGTYTWNVWALNPSGRRETAAVVTATVSIGS